MGSFQLGCPSFAGHRAQALHIFPVCIVTDANAKVGVSHRMHCESSARCSHTQITQEFEQEVSRALRNVSLAQPWLARAALPCLQSRQGLKCQYL